jgi:23S rRNA (cytosine1962-C5)-methyltransferase
LRRDGHAVVSGKGLARIRAGHPWIYRSDVARRPDAESGAIVRVEDGRCRFAGQAHYGAESEITLRLLSRDERPIDRSFWQGRLRAAAARREGIVEGTEAYRLVHGEGDLLPGLVIDRYTDCFAIQTLTRGMEALKPLWVDLLVEEFRPRRIVERNDVAVRRLEGLPQVKAQLHADPARPGEGELTVLEHGVRYRVDPLEGQKTGAFLDQRENRVAAAAYARGRALDCFCFHGLFALHLAATCDEVRAVDISQPAVEATRRNAALNGITNVEVVEANVFDLLRGCHDAGERFDTIVLDPPAFAKNRGAVEPALRGYKEINHRAMRLLRPGGVLVTCSCSYHVGEAMFLDVLAAAARDAGGTFQVVERRFQSRDHPMLLAVPETRYLKCVVLRRIE